MKRFLSKTIAGTCLITVTLCISTLGCGKGKSSGGGGSEINASESWYMDADGDGFGDPDSVTLSDTQPAGYVDNPYDCNDSDAAIKPMAAESVDGIDNNCNGETDESPKAGVIPDTGQTESFTNTFGEDSDFVIDPPSFTKLDENGTPLPNGAASWSMVKDNVTGLIWEMKNVSDGTANFSNIHDADNTYTWSHATSEFIDELNTENFGNFSDGYAWRLPTIKELSFLSDNSRSNPSLNTDYFPKTVDGIWSSTPCYNSTVSAYYFTFNIGMTQQSTKTASYKVWAVRGKETDSTEYEQLDDRIMVDNTTGLMWQIETALGDTGSGYTFEEALSYCRSLNLSGYRDWRLPNKNELTTLIRYDSQKPATSRNEFPDTKSANYWTSTTQNYNHTYSWCINFSDGAMVHTQLKTGKAFIRAVRGGNVSNLNTWYKDGDGDGFGDRAVFVKINAQLPKPEGYVSNNTDCNDSFTSINPSAVEIADDGVDQNCNGSDLVTWYQDSDGDGFGEETDTVLSESKPSGYIRNVDDIDAGLFDCDDLSVAINPDIADLLDNGLDDDCNGRSNVSWYTDEDGDGYGAGPRAATGEYPPSDGRLYSTNDLDCDDGNSDIHPGLVEIFGDGTDSNCNGDSNDAKTRIVPDTGQTETYTAMGGEDGDSLINPRSYTKISSQGGVLPSTATSWASVRDNVTGLSWEVKTPSNMNETYTYSEALTYVSSLSLSGYSDWRLPTVAELSMISDLGRSNPAVSPDFFPNIISGRYWTDTDVGSESRILTVSFIYGQSYPADKTNHFSVIAVRSTHPSVSLTDNGDGTVTDPETGLVWNTILSASGSWNTCALSWKAANSCGYADWRLPKEEEAESLLNLLAENPSLDIEGFFPGIDLNRLFWSYTLSPSTTGYAFTYNLVAGTAAMQSVTTGLPSLGVRGTLMTRFVDNGDGTVFDSKTGLMWLKENGNYGLKMAFTGALGYCENLNAAGYSDWRLPNRNELLSLLDTAVGSWDAYIKAFPGSTGLYWTSSSSSSLDGNAWQIDFTKNAWDISLAGYSTQSNAVRAVRGGKIE